MCCAAGLPMQIALSQLLAIANPDRLLVEPTGLGHPKEVLDSLSAKHYQNTLSLQKTITLIDSRKLRDLRITQNDIWDLGQILEDEELEGNASQEDRECDLGPPRPVLVLRGGAQIACISVRTL